MAAKQTLFRILKPLLFLWAALSAVLVGIPFLIEAVSGFLPPASLHQLPAFLQSPTRWGGAVAITGFPMSILAALLITWLRRRTAADGPAMILLPRRDAKTLAPGKVSFWAQAADILPRGTHVSFEFSGDSEKQTFSIRAAERNSRAMMVQTLTAWGGAQTRTVDGDKEIDPMSIDERNTWWVEIRPKYADRAIESTSPDPLLALMTDISRLAASLQGGLQILARGDPFSRSRLGSEAAQRTSVVARGKSLQEKRDDKGLDSRASQTFLEARVIVWASAPGLKAARKTARGLARTLIAQFTPSNPLTLAQQGKGHQILLKREYGLFTGRPWTHTELALIAHLTGKEGLGAAPQLRTAAARALPPSPAVRVPTSVQTIIPLESLT